MKVTFLTFEYPPNVYGGAGVQIKYLTRALSSKIHVEVRTAGTAGKTEDEKIKVLRYEPWKILRKGGDPKFNSLLEAFSLDLALVKDPIDSEIVHAHTWYMSLAGFYSKQLYGAKLVTTVHSLEPKRPWKAEAIGNAYRLSTWAEQTGLTASDKIIAVSRADRDDIVDCYGINSNRIEVIPNGVDIEKYRKKEDPSVLRKYGIKKPYVLFLGRLSRQKGVFETLKASDGLPKEVKLVLVTGKADERGLENKLAKEVRRRKNILWIDKMLTEEETVALYSDAEVFVSPSVYEPFGIMNLEAMACSLPVVSTKVGGIKDVVLDGETGILVSPRSPVEIVEAVNKLLGDPLLAKRMGEKGRKRVEKEFSWETIAQKTLALYESLL